MKRDGLVIELFRVMDEARKARARLVERYKVASKKLAVAKSVEGVLGVRSAAFALTKQPELDVRVKAVMGVRVSEIKAKGVRKRLDERGYGVIGTSEHIDEAAECFEDLVEEIVKTAEAETALRHIMDEIEGTKRRVNALEFRIIPGLELSEGMIRQRLEEMERENIFRLKLLKGEA